MAKTDALDAAVLARVAVVIQPPERALPDPQTQELAAVLAMQWAEQNRLDRTPARVRKRIEAHLRWLNAELARLDEDLDAMIAQSPVWREREDLVQSVQGIGQVMSRTVLAELPELGLLNRKQVAGLIGVAPLNRDSGRLRPPGPSGADARRCARRSTWPRWWQRAGIRQFYQRLRTAGKPPKVALVAAMRKLLTILNCDGASWNSVAIRSGAGSVTFKTVARLFARCGLAGRPF